MANVPRQLILVILFSILPLIAWTNQEKLTLEVDGQFRNLTGIPEVNSNYHDMVFTFPTKQGAGYHYKFYLKGLERTWHHSVYPVTRYINLSGGRYWFYLQVWQGNKKLSEHTAAFTVREDFWKKWGFSLFAAFVGLSFISVIIYFWFLYDFRQRMKVQEIRQRIAEDLHNEVGASLSSITLMAELLREKINTPESDLNTLIEKISSNSRDSAALISDTIWALNPDYDSIEKLIEKMKSFATEMLAATDIALTFHADTFFRSILSIDQRRDIYLIFKEAVINVAKHSGASEVIISIIEKNNSLEIAVTDNGKGFDPQKIYEGKGLKKYAHHSHSEEISVTIESQPDNGTTIRIITHENH